MFAIHMGIPEMEEFWKSLSERVSSGKASKKDIKLYYQIGKALRISAGILSHSCGEMKAHIQFM